MSLPGVAVGGLSASYIVVFLFPILCVPSVSTGNLATSPVPGTFSQVASYAVFVRDNLKDFNDFSGYTVL